MLHGVRCAPRAHATYESPEKRTPSVNPLFTTPEHRHLGNHITLTWPDPTHPDGVVPLSASSPHAIFHLHALDPSLNALHLSYGSLTSLAGDFYGTYQPISDGPTLDDRVSRFTSSWNLLTREPPSVAELARITSIENKLELDPLLHSDPSEPPSSVYARISDLRLTTAWFAATRSRTPSHGYSQTYPGYLGLVLTNWDHFGASAHTAYIAGHTAALRAAAAGTKPEDLQLAYALNAFADHFLEDAFSAGHLRVPRRALHDHATPEGADLEHGLPSVLHLPVADVCASLMHDEDSALGLDVRNAEGDAWTCYGDDYLFDECGRDTLRLCVKAMQRSADEVYAAFTNRTVAPPAAFAALRLVPTIESAMSDSQRLAPLFKLADPANTSLSEKPQTSVVLRRGADLHARTAIGNLPIPGAFRINRTDWNDYTDDFWYATTWAACRASGRWEWPMVLEEGLGVGGEDVGEEEERLEEERLEEKDKVAREDEGSDGWVEVERE